MNKQAQLNLWYLFIAFTLIFLFQGFQQYKATQPLTYSEMLGYLDQGEIESIYIGSRSLSGTFRNPVEGKTQFVTPRVDPALIEQLEKYDVEFTGVVENTFFRDLISWVAPALVFFLVWFFLFRKFAEKQGLGNFTTIGANKAKVYVEKDIKVTFDDVAGADEAKEEVKEVVEFLKNPQEYTKLGARMPKGILLVGPPGTGKTLLAKAIAGEAGVPFFSISGSEFIEMFVGVGAARVRDLFEKARQSAPAIIFIDELDALGRARGGFAIGGHDEREQTLNQLLTELDGFDTSTGVIILAATNRPEILDPALLRAGRFDRQVLVDRPDKKGREDILKVHIKKIKYDPAIDLEKVASITTGFTGADLENLVNEAALLATRRKSDIVTFRDFEAAVERIIAGLEKKNRVMNREERNIVAHHELGHAIVAMSLPGTDPVQKISIIPRGIGALGYTLQRPTEDRYLMRKEDLENKIAVLLGGRAAEQLVFGKISTGASDDLARASDIARTMVTTYGMDEEIGNVSLEDPHRGFLGQQMESYFSRPQYSEKTAEAIDKAVGRHIEKGFSRALSILEVNKGLLVSEAKKLLKRETFDEPYINKIRKKLMNSKD